MVVSKYSKKIIENPKIILNYWKKALGSLKENFFLYLILLRKIVNELVYVERSNSIKEVTGGNLSRAYTYRALEDFYFSKLPSCYFKHRLFFSKKLRGYGENPFHSMWYLLFREFKPENCLEIGVYRGQVISLWQLLAKKLELKVKIYAISPFTPAGDEV